VSKITPALLLALLVSLFVFAGCPERALEIPEDGFTRFDAGRDLAGRDLAKFDMPVDLAMQKPNPCPAGTEFIFTIDEDTTLSRFNPKTLEFFDVGPISCPSSFGDTPNSMAIDRDGNGWVNYQSGDLFRLITATAACSSTPYVAGSGGFGAFGMSFAQDTPGSTSETLFIADTAMGAASKLGSIDLATFTISSSVPIIGGIEPELTGDDQANLWGFFPADSPPRLARIDKQLGTLDRVRTLTALSGNPLAWGVAAFQGDFFIFLQRDVDASTQVHQVDGTTGTLTTVLASTGRRIVGVGVATCAGDDGLGDN
jgi:hypothetical protein